METSFGDTNTMVSLVRGDITHEETDAIVNAANSRLAGGGGVDGAIHRAGGPSIMEECRAIGGCATGSAVITGAGELKARNVIHAVGPVYKDGASGEEALLRATYRRCLELAIEFKLKSVAFPSISTGAYGYPVKSAASVALLTVLEYIREAEGLEIVRFVLFHEGDLRVYTETLKRLSG